MPPPPPPPDSREGKPTCCRCPLVLFMISFSEELMHSMKGLQIHFDFLSVKFIPQWPLHLPPPIANHFKFELLNLSHSVYIFLCPQFHIKQFFD